MLERIVNLIPAECPPDTEYAAWFLSPLQHAIESPLIGGLAAYFAYTLGSPAGIKKVLAETRWSSRRSLPEIILLILAVASFSLIIYHKIMKQKVGFLLQPCHVCHVLLILTLALPRGPGAGALCFNYYIHWLFSPFLGLVAAELDCYQQRFELANWFVQHALLMVAPVVLVRSRRHPTATGARFFFHAFALAVLYHFAILEVMSPLTGLNINYMYCPITALQKYGKLYRVLMSLATGVIAAIARYLVLVPLCWLVGTSVLPQDDFWLKPGSFSHSSSNSADETATTSISSSGKSGSKLKSGGHGKIENSSGVATGLVKTKKLD